MESSKKEKLKLFGIAITAILLFSILLMKDRLLFWELHQSGIHISQSEFDVLMMEAKSRPSSCSLGFEVNGNCYLMGAKGFMVKVGEPKK